MKTKFSGLVGAVCLAVALSHGLAIGQSGPEIVRRALDRYTENTANVDNYRMTMETLGFETSVFLVKHMVDGHPVFVPADTNADSLDAWQNPYRSFHEIADRAQLEGTESVGGNECHRVFVDDFEGIDFGDDLAGGQDFRPEYMALCFDTGNSLIRKMNFRGHLTTDEGVQQPVSFEALFSDYRNVGGMDHPYKTIVTAEGLMGPGSQMSEEDMAEARESLAELEKSMEEMSERERSMMERVMGPQLERLREMVDSGQFRVEMNVKSIEVNVSPDAN